ncbi:MAG: Trp biosynthesis-associated membrane protein [Micrococcaceae bacterium]
MIKISKSKIIGLFLLLALLVLATTTQSWFSVSAANAAAKVQAVQVQGKDAATSVPAFAIVAAATALALTIAQKRTALLLSVFAVLASIATTIGVVVAFMNPHQAVRETAGKLLGSVSESQQISTNLPLYIALFASLCMVATAFFAVLNVNTWKTTSKYERNSLSDHGDSIDSWDALTQGNDPTK